MAGSKATALGTRVARGEYIVDAHAVAEAIVRRRLRKQRALRVLEPGETLGDRSVRPDEDGVAPGGDTP